MGKGCGKETTKIESWMGEGASKVNGGDGTLRFPDASSYWMS